MSVRPVYFSSSKYPDDLALVDRSSSYTYRDLYFLSYRLSQKLLSVCNPSSSFTSTFPFRSEDTHIGILCSNDVSYVLSIWACFMIGCTCIPLSSQHPPSMLSYFLNDSECKALISTIEHNNSLDTIQATHPKLPIMLIDSNDLDSKLIPKQQYQQQPNNEPTSFHDHLLLTNYYDKRNALILYTSGTSGKPKGCVITHNNIQAYVESMTKAWKWTNSDVLLHVLPLHHTHGLINCLLTPLSVGATIVMMPKFNASEAWQYLASPGFEKPIINVFHAVPTIYSKLIDEYDSKIGTDETRFQSRNQAREFIKDQCQKMIRLMVCGSAALPTTLYEKWKQISGHDLLERYGMTEIGMTLTNPLDGERCVGRPFSGVEIKIVNDDGEDLLIANSEKTEILVTDKNDNQSIEGELLVRGPNVFKEYWKRKAETKKTFTKDGWFKTGDIARYEKEHDVFSIRGRLSMDILKRAGYKISALDIERVLLQHELIAEVAVVGIQDQVLGQKILAVIVIKQQRQQSTNLTIDDVRQFAKQYLPSYSLPDLIKKVDELPRNVMGKINKKELLNTLMIKN
ncbi:unnamed protein product [Didymodactylos carnosus]|uniref:Uncharacterized protein n=1 Tax=Didymodactylos carnosus TaxID=1234261 RepID=A0A814WYB8_9BILA|nr:unnamed protein product [Didymodactylos carnosus]CAF1207076.1 unnamed protein product [Didymodactylos carnosus]CAF3666618.1 unnamed protein product [Didymodactylos carnosus]CAF3971201.1 unnamed protein product [Didymodactylos carnosus]